MKISQRDVAAVEDLDNALDSESGYTGARRIVFFSLLMKYTQYVLNERLYLNALVVPHLKPYLEVGYGIGTHIFDFGLFASFANWKYQEIGCKFTFELFNR